MKKTGRLKQITSLLLTALLVAGMATNAFAAGTQLTEKGSTDKEAAGVSAAEIGKVRVQILSDTLARVEVKGPNGYEDRPTYHVVNRDWPGAQASKVVGEKETRIITGKYTVNVPNDADSLSGVTVTDAKGKQLWAYTSLPSAEQFLPAPGSTPRAWAIADNPRVVPAEWGYSPMPESNTSFPDYNGWDSTNQSPDMYIFVPQRDAQQLRKDFIALTGRTELVPLKTLGLWHSRYHAYSEQDVYDVINQYRSEGFPLDQFVVDTDWRVNASTGYEINTKLFPDMERFLQNAHDDYHVNVVFNDHPEPVNGQQALSQEDLIYRNTNLRNLLNMGLDTWWFDRNWHTTIKTPFSGINKESFGMYLYQDITRSNSPNLRPLIMGNVDGIDNGVFNRAPNLSSHRYSIQWTGDTHGQPKDLKQEIVDAVRSGAETLIPYVSADVGGHMDVLPPEMWTRWTQYAALSPIFRYHCTAGENLDRAPWLYGEKAEDIAREYINMRYRLLPLFYSLSHQNYETGLPITKRLDYNYPGYAQAQDNTQYLLGDGILVAPIWDAGAQAAVIPASWLTNEDGAGLKARFFNNAELKDPAVLSRTDAQVDFNWGTSSPADAVQKDNFSASWEGKVTIGGEDSRLAVTSDDGVRLYVDGNLVIDNWKASDSVTKTTDQVYQAGTAHDVKIEYYEGAGNAVLKFQYLPTTAKSDSRSVFIPDGRWIDVWSGQAYTGPRTITVSHNTDTSPIFVRSGSIVPLVNQPEESIEQTDWSKVALDVYPSTQLKGASELYEDDQKTVAYKEGKFRTTALETTFDKSTGEAVVNIGAAKGTYDNAPAFSSRTWKVRVHVPSGWGEVTSVKLNGETVSADTLSADSAAAPFAFEGGAPDGNIREIVFDRPLNEASEIRIGFSSPQDETLPSYSDVPVETDLSEKMLAGSVDLTAQGKDDWIHFGAQGTESVNKKAESTGAIQNVSVQGTRESYSSGPVQFSWSGGAPQETAKNIRSGVALTDGKFAFDVSVGREQKQIKLYLLSDNATGRLEVTDGTGSSAQTAEVSGSGRTLKQIVISAQAEGDGKLHILYEKAAGTGSVSLMAAAVSDYAAPEETSIVRSAALTPVPAAINLSDEKNIDWMHVGLNSDANAINRKKDVSQLISAPQASSNYFKVDDYNSNISWSDGAPTESVSNSHNAIATGGSFQIAVPSSPEWRELKIYLGCWNGTNKIEIFGENEEAGKATSFSYSAGSTAEIRCLTVKYRSEKDSSLYVKWSKSAGSGNVSFAACSLSEVGSSDAPVRASLEEIPDALNLSDGRFVEWAHFGYQDGNAVNRKTGVPSPVIGDNKDLLGHDLLRSDDYKTAFSWSDGTPVPSVTATRDLAHSFDGQQLTLNLLPGNWKVSVYTSVWWASGTVEVVDETGAVVDVLRYESSTASAGASQYRKVVLDYRSDKVRKLTVRVMPALAADGHRGNMSLVAATVEKVDLADRSELQEILEQAKNYPAALYTEGSYRALQEAITAGEALIPDLFAEQQKIDHAAQTVRTAIDQLVLKNGRDHLLDLIAACEALDENKFEAESWANLQAKLSAAKAVAGNPEATSETIGGAFDQLARARNDLVYRVDKDILQLSIELAQKTDITGCTSGSIAALNEALEAAQNVLNQADATQEEVNDAAKDLLNAIINLKDIMADKAELQKLADLAAGLTEAKYTPASWSTVKGALEAAQALLPDDDATQEAVDGAYGTLAQAIAHLTLRAQTNSLNVAIELAQTVVSELDQYAPTTVEGLQEKLDAAKAVQGNLNATQEEVDAAAKALAEAAAKARLKANKKDLQQAYAQAQKLGAGKYTEGSVRRLSAALTTTAAVLENENATQQEVDQAKDVLSDAVRTLEVKTAGGTENSSSSNSSSSGNGSSSSSNNNSSSNNSSSGNGSSSSLNSSSSENAAGIVSTVPTGTGAENETDSPQTGEPFPTAVPVLSMAALTGMALILIYRKKLARHL